MTGVGDKGGDTRCNKPDYDREMLNVIGEADKRGQKANVLLHACCAPCASACIERLLPSCELTVYFYNPNIDGKEEYALRAKELKRLCDFYGVKAVIEEYTPNEFYSAIRGKEDCKERGERCFICYRLRLRRAAEYAKRCGYGYFATTLTLSPLKDAAKLNEIGRDTGKELGIDYLPSDFKKKNGYLRSIELSKKYGLYRQNYCGCVYSKKQDK